MRVATSGLVLTLALSRAQGPSDRIREADHLSYARAGVPALFFTTLLHPDYHTPNDNPDRIDLAKLTRMTRWIYATGRAVGESDKAPAVDPAFKLERCRDSTGDYCGG